SGRHHFGLAPEQDQRFHFLHESLTPHGQAFRPTRFPFHFVPCDSLGQAGNQILAHFLHVVSTQVPTQSLQVNQPIPLPTAHDFVIADPCPVARVLHHAAPHHVQLDV